LVKENGGGTLPSLELVLVGVPEENLMWLNSAKQNGGCRRKVF
jgi:hypothetical protein